MDWYQFYLPAIRALLNGNDPYSFAVFNPPWAFAPLIPFALLPDPFGYFLMLAVAVFCIGFTVYRLGGRLVAIGAILFSPLVLNSLIWGNIEWLALLGLVVTPWFGLILLALKPQITFVAMVLIMYRERKRPRVFVPLAAISLASLLAFGLYPLRILGYGNYAASFNVSLFPLSIPLGLILVYQSFRSQKLQSTIAAAPLFAPTLSQTAWAGLPLALARRPAFALLTTFALWICVAVTGSLWWF